MDSVAVLRLQAELAYQEVLTAIEGISKKQSWGVLAQGGADYLHTDGSIYGIVLHLASCKFVYGSVAFRRSEVRWRDCADRMDKFEPNWKLATDYLDEAHKYWVSSWSSTMDTDLENEVPHFSGAQWPVWRIVQMVTHHDSYHAGQIAVLQYAVAESDLPPASGAEDIRTHCKDLPSW